MAQYLDKDGLDNLLSMINNNFVKFGDLDIPKPKVIVYTEVEGWSYGDFESCALDFLGVNPVVYVSELMTVSQLTLAVNEDEMYEFHSICKVNETSMVKVVISATADEEGNYTVTQNLVEIPLEGGSGNVPTKTSELTNDSGFITASDNVASATKLQTMRYINGSPFDGTGNVVSYAVCTTGASVSVKTVNISNFNLITGSQVRVKFNNTNTASAPTLNVGSTGAKRMSYKGNLITNANFSFSTAKIYTFTYDGTYWVLEGDWDEAPKTSILTCEFMGEVGDVIWSDGDDHDRMDYIADWMEALSLGKVCVLDFDEYEGTYAMVHAINYRNDATYGIGKVYFSYVFEGYLYEVEYDEVALPVTLTIVSKTKIGGTSEGGSSAYAEVNHGTSDTTFELTSNTFHVWDEVASLDLSLGAETTGVANEYLFQFTSGSTPTTLTLPDDIKFSEDLVIEANKIYQISILKGLGSVLSWDNGVALIENKATYNEGDFMNGGTLTFEYPTESEIKLYLNNYSSPYLTIPAGTTTIAIDWYEPLAPSPQYFFPSSDDTYIYIIA